MSLCCTVGYKQWCSGEYTTNTILLTFIEKKLKKLKFKVREQLKNSQNILKILSSIVNI